MIDRAQASSVVLLDRETARRFVDAVRRFVTSAVGGKARALFGVLFVLLLAISGLNVLTSYIGRDFMTAIERRDRAGFAWETLLYISVFAASTVAAVIFRFTEERLGLLWREWLTRRLVGRYLRGRLYYRLQVDEKVENPDQRISEDVRAFTTMTLSLLLMVLNGTVTVVAFSGVLWSISRRLFVVGVLYAAAGSLLTVLFGRPLVRLNYDQEDREADFRSTLIHVREHAESIAVLDREPQLTGRLQRRIDALVTNMKRIIAVNRNVGFFVTGYNYMIQLIPALIVAPLFMRGAVEFGVITQSAMAFAHLLGAFSLIVTQFQTISSYTAVLARLGVLIDAAEQDERGGPEPIEVVHADRLAYEHLTLRSPRDGRTLLRDLSATIEPGARVLVRGGEDGAAVALFRATAGMWKSGEGRIILPGAGSVQFLPEHPYLAPGTLRETLVGGGSDSDERLVAALHALGAEQIVARAGGLDAERAWDDVLSLSEQQLVSVAHVLLAGARFALLDRVGSALEAAQVARVLQVLTEHGVACVVGDGELALEQYDAILELAAGGAWTWTTHRSGRPTTGGARGAGVA